MNYDDYMVSVPPNVSLIIVFDANDGLLALIDKCYDSSIKVLDVKIKKSNSKVKYIEQVFIIIKNSKYT